MDEAKEWGRFNKHRRDENYKLFYSQHMRVIVEMCFYKVILVPYLRTYLLSPWSRVLLEKLTGFQLVKKFPAFHWTRRFITAFKSAPYLSLFWASSIQSVPPHPTSWRSILILYSHLSLGLRSGLLRCFPTKTLYTPLLSPLRATCPANIIIFDLITRTISGERYRLLRSSLCT